MTRDQQESPPTLSTRISTGSLGDPRVLKSTRPVPDLHPPLEGLHPKRARVGESQVYCPDDCEYGKVLIVHGGHSSFTVIIDASDVSLNKLMK